MIIGVPKEIKNNENRVALTPGGAKELTKLGHTVYVQTQAGVGSGFDDVEYLSAGAEMLPTIEAVYEAAEMIIKVKEPIEREYALVRQDQLLFTYFHFASSEPLTRAMQKSGAVCLAYETVELPDRSPTPAGAHVRGGGPYGYSGRRQVPGETHAGARHPAGRGCPACARPR